MELDQLESGRVTGLAENREEEARRAPPGREPRAGVKKVDAKRPGNNTRLIDRPCT
jgi:hypothetical protein